MKLEFEFNHTEREFIKCIAFVVLIMATVVVMCFSVGLVFGMFYFTCAWDFFYTTLLSVTVVSTWMIVEH